MLIQAHYMNCKLKVYCLLYELKKIQLINDADCEMDIDWSAQFKY